MITSPSEYHSANMHPSTQSKKCSSLRVFFKTSTRLCIHGGFFSHTFLISPKETELHTHQTISLVLLHGSCEHIHCFSKGRACWLPLKSIKVAEGSATSKIKELQLGRTKFCLPYFLWPLFQRIHCTTPGGTFRDFCSYPCFADCFTKFNSITKIPVLFEVKVIILSLKNIL